MNLPIDVMPGTEPPRFRWQQIVTTPTGIHKVDNAGTLPPAVEGAVRAIINIAKQLAADNADLRNMLNGLAARVAAQSELLSKRAEKDDAPPPQPSRKGK